MIHIRNGEDILPLLRALDRGPAMSWDDPVCQGPLAVTEGSPEWYDRRAEFLARAYLRDRDATRANLIEQDQALAAAFDHDEIVLWFEADLYCQAVLVRLLAHLAEHPEAIPRTRLICIGEHPAVEWFVGLGQLRQEEIAELFPTRAPVTESQVRLAERAWAALCARRPEPLNEILGAETSVLPFLGTALRRFAEEYPAVADGLSRTERLVLQAVADGTDRPGALFGEVQQREPVPWMGDLMLWPVVDGLRPLVEIDGPERWYADRESLRRTTLRLTDAGRAVLDGTQSRTPPARWLGGVELGPGRPDHRWDKAAGRVTQL